MTWWIFIANEQRKKNKPGVINLKHGFVDISRSFRRGCCLLFSSTVDIIEMSIENITSQSVSSSVYIKLKFSHEIFLSRSHAKKNNENSYIKLTFVYFWGDHRRFFSTKVFHENFVRFSLLKKLVAILTDITYVNRQIWSLVNSCSWNEK